MTDMDFRTAVEFKTPRSGNSVHTPINVNVSGIWRIERMIKLDATLRLLLSFNA